jgi:hypothetical protein
MGDTVIYKGNPIDYDMVMSKYANQRIGIVNADKMIENPKYASMVEKMQQAKTLAIQEESELLRIGTNMAGSEAKFLQDTVQSQPATRSLNLTSGYQATLKAMPDKVVVAEDALIRETGQLVKYEEKAAAEAVLSQGTKVSLVAESLKVLKALGGAYTAAAIANQLHDLVIANALQDEKSVNAYKTLADAQRQGLTVNLKNTIEQPNDIDQRSNYQYIQVPQPAPSYDDLHR